MEESILKSTKKILGVDPKYSVFDLDIITHINTFFSTLNQLGLGPINGFMIEDDTAVWADFINDNMKINSVKTYIFLRTRLVFDPPATSYVISALERQVQELEFRLNVTRETTDWVDPDPVVIINE